MKKSKKDEQMREFILELQKESKEDFERARARDNINIYRDIRKFIYNKTRTIGQCRMGSF